MITENKDKENERMQISTEENKSLKKEVHMITASEIHVAAWIMDIIDCHKLPSLFVTIDWQMISELYMV